MTSCSSLLSTAPRTSSKTSFLVVIVYRLDLQLYSTSLILSFLFFFHFLLPHVYVFFFVIHTSVNISLPFPSSQDTELSDGVSCILVGCQSSPSLKPAITLVSSVKNLLTVLNRGGGYMAR
jgi:hypothetical protein